jgi:hypothetical protein
VGGRESGIQPNSGVDQKEWRWSEIACILLGTSRIWSLSRRYRRKELRAASLETEVTFFAYDLRAPESAHGDIRCQCWRQLPGGFVCFGTSTSPLIGPRPPSGLSYATRSPQPLELTTYDIYQPWEAETTRTFPPTRSAPNSPTPLQRLTLALRSNPWSLSNTLHPTTRLSSSRRIAGICSSTQSQRQAEQRFPPPYCTS